MTTDDKLSATGNNMRALTIQIINSSYIPVIINYGQLTGGDWDGPGPMPGDMIEAGEASFANGGNHDALGGTIQLSSTSGGTITITWSWPLGGAATGSASGTSLTGLSLKTGVVNKQT
ncbi:MAG: hypothetical protein ABIS51_11815 [Sphingomonas sp.]